MLLIRAIRTEPLSETDQSYDVAVFVNAIPIWRGKVSGHNRSDGWAVLAGHIAHKAGIQSLEQRHALESGLQGIYDVIAPVCPACARPLWKRR